MKKVIYLVILLALINNPIAHAQKIRTLFYDEFLFGKVKMTSQTQYPVLHFEMQLKDTTWYDENGNTLEDHTRSPHGTLFAEKYINTSDSSGRKMQVIYNLKDQNLSMKFDSKGNLVERDSYLKNGSINFSAFYEYDARNNLISLRNVDKNPAYSWKRTYKYDKDDVRIAADTWGPDGKLRYHTEFVYSNFDEKGNWKTRLAHDAYPNGKVEDQRTTRQITYY